MVFIVLVSLVLGLFAAMLFINFYFRWKVMKLYHYLTKNKIEFQAEHILSPSKLQAEIIPKYPASKTQIESFVHYVRFSVKIAGVLVVLTALIGGTLMYYSKYGS